MTRLDKTLLATSFLGLFPAGLLLPIYAIFVKNIGGDILDAGVAYGLFSISGGIFILLMTRTALFQTHLRHMAVVGYALVALGECGYFFVSNPIQLFITQIITGIATGILDPSWDSLYSTEKTETHAVHSWSMWSAGQRIVTGLGAVIGALVVGHYSFTALFCVMLVFNILAVIVSLRLVINQAV